MLTYDLPVLTATVGTCLTEVHQHSFFDEVGEPLFMRSASVARGEAGCHTASAHVLQAP